tara:strand:- start:398 stop:1243 length:846 start_codon:yes stop_codon:yes gene_type:complete
MHLSVFYYFYFSYLDYNTIMDYIIKTGTDHLKASFRNGIITLTLNNPRYKNALSEKLTPYLRKILKKIQKDSKYKLMIIRGEGDSFCSGGNIKGMNDNSASKNKNSQINNLIKKQDELTGVIYSLKIPTIALITGAAAGAGFSIALACDFRIGNKASFFVSNYSRIGLSGDYGISFFLTKLLGESKAKEIMIFNKRIYSDEAYQIGLLNFLYKRNFENNVRKVCDEIASLSPFALEKIKQNVKIATLGNLNTLLKAEAKSLIECTYSKEHKEAVKNFIRKK